MDKTKVVAGIAFGVAIGSAMATLYGTDKGIKARKKLGKKGLAYMNDLKGKFDELVNGFIEKMEITEDAIEETVKDTKKAAVVSKKTIVVAANTAQTAVKKQVKKASKAIPETLKGVGKTVATIKKTTVLAGDKVKAAIEKPLKKGLNTISESAVIK